MLWIVLCKHLTCWTLEIEESYIKTHVLHFFVFHKEEDLGRGSGEEQFKDWVCWARSQHLFGVSRAAAQDTWAVWTVIQAGELGG